MMLKGDSVPREGKGPYLAMIRMESFLYNISLVTSDDSRNKNNPALINQWQMKIYTKKKVNSGLKIRVKLMFFILCRAVVPVQSINVGTYTN